MNNNRTVILVGAFVVAVAALAATSGLFTSEPASHSVRVVLASEVEWGALNPLRGDASPRAGTLWGTRTSPVPSGFLVKFVDGFSSPPHIHPVTYRGIVISGLVHNADPAAEEVWLPPASFWTQPAGEVHITAAKGTDNVAYIEIEKGPYRVLPADEAFERPEAPIQMDASSMAWLDAAGMPAAPDGPKVAALAGNPDDAQMSRRLVRLPAGFKGTMHSSGATLHAVVVDGQVGHHVPDETQVKSLTGGSYFGSDGDVTHHVACDAGAPCILYVRTEGTFALAATP